MPLVHAALLFTGSLLVPPQAPSAPRAPECRAWPACRELALDAAAHGDYERFHDLAWRAVQLGPKNDPALMLLLARAQSLSGRPGDAAVMIERLAALGVIVDIAADDDFRRLRRNGHGDTHLYGKSLNPQGEIEKAPKPAAAGLATAAPPAAANDLAAASSAAAAPAPAAADARSTSPAAAGPLPPAFTSPPARRLARSAESPAPTLHNTAAAPGLEPLRFTMPRFTPAGLAYDAVSRRFVVGDRDGRRLAVVDEFSRSVANLAGARTAGFGRIAALEIDPKRGDLWVVSSEGSATSLHKLQLISGRVLEAYPVPERFAPASFGDVAVADGGIILTLDTTGHRLFRLQPGGAAAEPVCTLPDAGPTSLAPAGADVVYVATASGIDRVSVLARTAVALKSAPGVDLAGLTRIRWHRGALAGIQRTGAGSYRAVRIALDSQGRRASSLEVLDPSLTIGNPTAATVIAGILYYLADDGDGGMAVRRLALR